MSERPSAARLAAEWRQILAHEHYFADDDPVAVFVGKQAAEIDVLTLLREDALAAMREAHAERDRLAVQVAALRVAPPPLEPSPDAIEAAYAVSERRPDDLRIDPLMRALRAAYAVDSVTLRRAAMSDDPKTRVREALLDKCRWVPTHNGIMIHADDAAAACARLAQLYIEAATELHGPQSAPAAMGVDFSAVTPYYVDAALAALRRTPP